MTDGRWRRQPIMRTRPNTRHCPPCSWTTTITTSCAIIAAAGIIVCVLHITNVRTAHVSVFGWRHDRNSNRNNIETATQTTTTSTTATNSRKTIDTLEALLQYQVQASNEFQALIHRNQHSSVASTSSSSSSLAPCRERRVLMMPPMTAQYDGFTLELHAIGRYLQIAVTTDRTLVLRNNFTSGYAPPNYCTWRTETVVKEKEEETTASTPDKSAPPITTINVSTATDPTQGGSSSWNCLYQPISDCTEPMIWNSTLTYVPSTHTSARGIDDPDWSNTMHFGSNRIVTGADWTNKGIHLDHVAAYERLYGRFWVRSQIQHYLWKPSAGLFAEMQARMPLTLQHDKYIGVHVRFSDNIGSFRTDFGRDAVQTRNLNVFMDIAQTIRSTTGISTIYLATDSNRVLDTLKNHTVWFRDWTFVVQANVPRTSGDEWFWFQNSRAYSAAAIATDLEVLRNADYLIGSFQSNVYRLAAELNTATHLDKYPLYQNRHFSVDVEWYEDP